MANQTQKAKQYEPGTLAFLVIFGIFLCALGVMVLLSVFGMQGGIFAAIRKVSGGLFGCLGFGIGALLIWTGILVAMSSGRKMPKRALLLSVLLYLCLLALFNLFSRVGDTAVMDMAVERSKAVPLPNPDSFGNVLSQMYKLSSVQGLFGGAAGVLLAWPLWKYLGNVPSIILLVVLCIACLLFIVRFDFVKLSENLMAKRNARREEQMQQEALEQQQRRQYEQQLYQQQSMAGWPNMNMPQQMPGMPAQQPPYGMPPYNAMPQQPGFNPYGQQQFVTQQNMIPEGMTEAPQGELYNEIIFPEDAEPTWKKKKGKAKAAKEEQPDARSRWVDNPYTLGDAPKPVSTADLTDGGGENVFLSRSKKDAVEKLEQLRRRKQQLTERLESNRLAVEEQRKTAPLPTQEPIPAVPEDDFVLEPITPPAPAPAADPRSSYRRPEPQPEFFAPIMQDDLEFEETVHEEEPVKTSYVFPPLDLLHTADTVPVTETRKQDEENAIRLENTLNSFGIPAKVQRVTHGPSVTRFELGLVSSGINVKKILSIADNIALDMSANGPVRFEVPIKGTNLFGIEIPNQKVQTITLREVLLSEEMQNAKGKLVVALGKDVAGKPVLCDLAKMPHLLIAGQTGSGKSVCINTIINSLLYRTSPEDVKLILVDPKVVELQCYNVIPHLLIPVVCDPMKAAGALTWALGEMQDRYRKMQLKKVRDLAGYNAKLEPGEPKMPRIVIIIDELADLMMASKKAVEETITRLAQLARAAGIHLIVATQRPTVNVVTGLIKSNIPSRIAFSVASSIDSRTILDQGGAETLLGHGDMFYAPTGISAPVRVQGCFLSDEEIEHITDFIAAHSRVEFDEDVIEALENDEDTNPTKEEDDGGEGVDDRLAEAIEMVVNDGQASISMLQRRMKVGYARAGRLIDEMANRGIVSRSAGSKPREVLITREEYERIKDAL
ncbi:MAG: hypothetical protein J6K72_00330 [Clostridia bacterium]|nr:hypothetical protein [Clostridia bacterium]